MSHLMGRGDRPCGLPDGHGGRHRSMKSVATRKKNSHLEHEIRVCRFYGLEPGEYEKLRQAQGGKCAICQRATGRTKRLSVDHCHKTREVRGLLCATDNRMLGHIRDDPAALQRAIEYLAHPPAEAALGRVPLVPEDSPAQVKSQPRRRRR